MHTIHSFCQHLILLGCMCCSTTFSHSSRNPHFEGLQPFYLIFFSRCLSIVLIRAVQHTLSVLLSPFPSDSCLSFLFVVLCIILLFQNASYPIDIILLISHHWRLESVVITLPI